MNPVTRLIAWILGLVGYIGFAVVTKPARGPGLRPARPQTRGPSSAHYTKLAQLIPTSSNTTDEL
jgi:hypothetical protein